MVRAQLNGIGQMHVKGASGSRQTAMNDPGAQQPSQMFFTWVKARPQHRELRALHHPSFFWRKVRGLECYICFVFQI